MDSWEVPSSSARPMGCRAWGTFNSGSPVIATLEWLDCDWEPHSRTFPIAGRSVAIVEGGLGPFLDLQCDRAGSLVAGGLGHAMIVGAIACDLSWRDGRTSVFEVQGGDRTSLVGVVRARRGVCMGKVEACSHDAEGCTRLCWWMCSVARRDMNCLDSDIGEPIKAAAFEEKDALIGVSVSFYEGPVRSLSVRTRISSRRGTRASA
ncbi:hypothetical protein CRG98_007664 [Punica granatum]|uniref:Uncharacterized protein n=1 Tax=Punica granatum TaxID=22663 RepID=A0A2I0KVQ7_PUNGR|nr:hypothetical protein CRG98_007664 [Punica granatum]